MDTADRSEGVDVQLLRVNFMKTAEEILRGATVEQWKSAFSSLPNVQRKVPNIYATFNREVLKAFEEDINDIIKETNIDEKLKQHHILTSQQDEMKNTIAWRPSGSVQNDMIAHDITALQNTKSKLLELLQQEEQTVTDLKAELEQARHLSKDYNDTVLKLSEKSVNLQNTVEKLLETDNLISIPDISLAD